MTRYFYKGFEIQWNQTFGEYWVYAPIYHNAPVFSSPFMIVAKQWIENVETFAEVRRAAANFGHS